MVSDIVKLVIKEIGSIEEMIRKLDKFLSIAPDGYLKWQHRGGKTYYYHQYIIKEKTVDSKNKTVKDSKNNTTKDSNRKCKRKYIKQDSLFAQDLARKQYYQTVKTALENKLSELKIFLAINATDELKDIYNMLSDERRNLVKPIKTSVEEQLDKWKEETYEKSSMYIENLKYETEQGELVRSKSEVIIANILYKHRNDILYKYERPLTLDIDRKRKTIYPDFTIINVHTGKIVYWEHAGKIDDEYYAGEFVKKINSYIANDLLIGKDVIVTFETQDNSLDIGIVKKLVGSLLDN